MEKKDDAFYLKNDYFKGDRVFDHVSTDKG